MPGDLPAFQPRLKLQTRSADKTVGELDTEGHRGRRGLLDYAANALPAAGEERIRGWRLRHTDSSMWWTGAVLAHAAEVPEALAERICATERFYAVRDASARFQICPACPPALESALDQRGYKAHSPMSLRVAAPRQIADRLPMRSVQVLLDDGPDGDWFQIWRAVNVPDGDPAAELRLFHRIDRPSGYATALIDDEPVAVGLAVAEGDWTGVFGMATLPTARGNGAGKAVLAALARWAADQDAAHTYVQVDRHNDAALELYERAGFTRAFDYHYRSLCLP